MKQTTKRLLALLLAFSMCFSLLGANVWASVVSEAAESAEESAEVSFLSGGEDSSAPGESSAPEEASDESKPEDAAEQSGDQSAPEDASESSVQPEPEESAQPEAEESVQPEPEESVRPEPEESVQPEAEESVQPEAEESVQPEAEESVQPEAEESVQPEAEESVQPEAEESVQPEAEESVQPEAEESVQPEAEESVQPEAEESVQPEAEESVQPEAEESVRPEAEESVQPEAEETKAAHSHNNITFTQWTANNGLPTSAGSYYLNADVSLSDTWSVPNGTVNLCLNGHSIIMKGTGSVISLTSGSALNLYDCSTTTHYVKLTNGRGTSVSTSSSSGAVQIQGGCITGGSGRFGGGVDDFGTFKMYGGNIVGCVTTSVSPGDGNGGGVYVGDEATFTMSGGSIKRCQALCGGGVRNHGSFTMSGGSIESCTATKTGYYWAGGGGVYNNGTFKMTGGSIKSCQAMMTPTEDLDDSSFPTCGGGGVYTDGSFTLSGGTIESCATGYTGGGVHVADEGTFTMSGSSTKIKSCSAESGGGVYVESYQNNSGSFTMSSGSIESCSVTDNGGGVFVGSDYLKSGDTVYSSSGTFTMSGGSIKSCKADCTSNASTGGGGGVYVYKYSSSAPSGTFNLKGGAVITGNTIKSGSTYIAENVTLVGSGTRINITGALSYADSNAIGIAMTVPGVFTSGLSGRGTAAKFKSEFSGYDIRLTSSGEAELYRLANTPTISANPVNLTWTYGDTAAKKLSVSASANGTLSYQWHKSTTSGFTPGTSTAISGATGSSYTVKASGAQINAGTAYYKCVVTNTLNGTSQTATSAQATVTVNKASLSPTVSMSDWTYGETASSPSVSGNTGNGAVTYKYKVSTAADSSYTTTKPSNAGTYTVQASIAATTNYNSATATKSFTIRKAANPLSFAATQSVTKTYSTAAQTATLTAATGGQGTVSYSLISQKKGTATVTFFSLSGTTLSLQASTPAGSYTVVVRASAAGNGNYESGTKDSTVTVTVSAAASSVTTAPTAKTLTYSGGNQALVNAGAASGGTMQYAVNTSSGTVPTSGWSASIPTGKDAKTYYVWYKVVGDSNHSDLAAGTSRRVKVTISQATLTATAKNKTITYGAAPANAGVSYSGFKGSDTASSVTISGTPTYTYSYTQYGDAGSYSITPDVSGLSATNYKFTAAAGTLTVEKKEVGLSWSGTALTYNGSAQKPAATATGVVNNDAIGVSVTGERTNAGTGYIAAASALTGNKKGNYKLPSANTTTFRIDRATPALSGLSAAPVTYGQTLSQSTVSGTAKLGSADVAGTWAFTNGSTVPAVSDSESTAFGVTFTPDDTANFNSVTTLSSTLTVNRADLTAFSVSLEGWTYGETAWDPIVSGNTENGSVSFQYKVKDGEESSYSDQKPSSAGTYTVKATAAQTANYNAASATADFTIARADVTVTADDLVKTFHTEDPELTATVTGLQNNEEQTVIRYTLSREPGEGVGHYTITPDGDAVQGNYNVAYAAGTLTILTANASVNAVGYEKEYDGQPHGISVTVTDNSGQSTGSEATIYYSTETALNGDNYSSGTTETPVRRDAGTTTVYYYIVLKNYAASEGVIGKKTITITQKPVGLTWNNTRFQYDGRSHAPTATATGLVGNDACTVTVTGAQSGAGTYTAEATALSNKNYKLSAAATQSYTITPREVGLSWSGTSFDYDGQAHAPTATATGLVGKDACTVTVTGAQSGAGTYTATATALSNKNYKLSAAATQSYTITPREVGLSWSGTSFDYDGQAHAPTATATGLVGNDACTVTVTGAQSGAGTYTATATALSNKNYKLPTAVTQPFTIQEAPAPTPENPIYDSLTESQKQLAERIAASLGVDAETAAQMVLVAAQLGVSADVMQLSSQKLASLNVDSRDPKGSTFYLLNARASKRANNSLTLQWKKHKKADGYLVYGNQCGKKFKLQLLKSFGKKTTKWTQRKLKKGTYYKYLVIAYKNVNGQKMPIAASVTVHSSTKGGKKTVAKGVTLTQGKKVVTRLTLKKKASVTLKASEVPEEKLKIASHRKVKFESDNTAVASVSARGKITAKKKGTATIYAYAQNGIFKTVKVTVK